MEYRIKLSNGMTEQYYNADKPIFGTGQGAGWSPPCWAANSDAISLSMEKYTPGALLVHPNGKDVYNNNLTAFVDDTSAGVTQDAIHNFKTKPEDPVQAQPTMHAQLEQNMGFYSRTLEATGGALSWEKCRAYLLLFDWSNGEKVQLNTKDTHPPINISNDDLQTIAQILLANPDEAFKMLGIYVSPDGNTKTQYKILKQKAKKWAANINRSFVAVHEALVAFKQVLFPALVYPLAVVSMSEQECDEIIRPAVQALLKKLHLDPNTTRDLLYGPARYGGLALPNLYVCGNVLKLMLLIGHLQKQDSSESIINISLATSQQQIGISRHFLYSNYNKYGYLLEDSWCKEIWRFLSEIQGSLEIQDAWIPTSIYEQDIFIMDRVFEINLPQHIIKKFNMCRLKTNTYFLSDILNSDFTKLHPDALNPNFIRKSHEKFPVITVPKTWWKHWREILKTIESLIKIERHNLGGLRPNHDANFLQSKDRQYLLKCMGKTNSTDTNCNQYPDQKSVSNQIQDDVVRDFLTTLSALPPSLRRNIGRIIEIKNLSKLAQAIELGDAISCADASVGDKGRASHATIIESTCESYRVVCVAPVDCNERDIESTRAELWGQIAAQTLINTIAEVTLITTGEIQICGDNKDSLVMQPIDKTKMSFPRFFRPNMDLKIQLQELRSERPKHIILFPTHIKGHQDRAEHFQYEEATQGTKRNIDMDELAKRFLQHHQGPLEPRRLQLQLPSQKANLLIADARITNNMQEHISLHFFGHRLDSRFKRVSSIDPKYHHLINWEARDLAYRKLSEMDKLALFKLLHEKWPTNMKTASWDANQSSLCQRCVDREETSKHIFQCTSTNASKQHKTSLKTFRKNLRKLNTAPLVLEAMTSIIESNRKGYDVRPNLSRFAHDDLKNVVRDIIKGQKSLGYYEFMKGLLSHEWVLAQNIYLNCRDVNAEKTKWAAGVIRAIWTYSKSIWKARNDYVYGKEDGKQKSPKRYELLDLLTKEIDRIKHLKDLTTRQLRKNALKSMGNVTL